jgi:peptidoglycan/xylan/chitin deacetylase (PgdA/CDA1 family)
LSAPFPTDRAVAFASAAPSQVPPGELPASEVLETKDLSWREAVAQIAYSTGALKLFGKFSRKYEPRAGRRRFQSPLRRVTQPKYTILCYHRVGMRGIPYYCTLPPAQFEMQMKFLRENFRVLSLGQLCEELNHPSGGGNGVAVTFDDGYSDLHTYALPILRKYEVPATIYLTADCIETGEVAWYDKIFLALQVAPGKSIDLPLQGGLRLELGSPAQRIENGARIVSILRKTPAAERLRFCGLLEKQVSLPAEKLAGRMLTWNQVREMRSAGIFFGSHTLSHPVLSQLAAEDVQMELRASRALLEDRLGEPVLDFAFPFGRPEDCGPVAEAAAARCGYRSAVTTTWGVNSPGANMHALKRVQLGEERTAAKFGLLLHQAFFQASDPAGSTPVSDSGSTLRSHRDTGVLAQR